MRPEIKGACRALLDLAQEIRALIDDADMPARDRVMAVVYFQDAVSDSYEYIQWDGRWPVPAWVSHHHRCDTRLSKILAATGHGETLAQYVYDVALQHDAE